MHDWWKFLLRLFIWIVTKLRFISATWVFILSIRIIRIVRIINIKNNFYSFSVIKAHITLRFQWICKLFAFRTARRIRAIQGPVYLLGRIGRPQLDSEFHYKRERVYLYKLKRTHWRPNRKIWFKGYFVFALVQSCIGLEFKDAIFKLQRTFVARISRSCKIKLSVRKPVYQPTVPDEEEMQQFTRLIHQSWEPATRTWASAWRVPLANKERSRPLCVALIH